MLSCAELFFLVLLISPTYVNTKEHCRNTKALCEHDTPENRSAYQNSLQKQKEIEMCDQSIVGIIALTNGAIILMLLKRYGKKNRSDKKDGLATDWGQPRK